MKKWKIIRLILSIVFVLVFVINAWLIIDYKLDELNADRLYKNMISDVVKPADEGPDNTPISVDFDALRAQNSDVVAWIYSADTPINYPVLKGNNNEQYLNTLIDGKTNKAGSLFVDYRLKDTVDESLNFII